MRPCAVTKYQGIRMVISERDLGQIAPGQVPCAFYHPLQDGVQIEGGVEPLRKIGHQLNFSPFAFRVLVQASILDGDRGLGGKQAQESAGPRSVKDRPSSWWFTAITPTSRS